MDSCLLHAPRPGIEPSTWVCVLTRNQTHHHPSVSRPTSRATPARSVRRVQESSFLSIGRKHGFRSPAATGLFPSIWQGRKMPFLPRSCLFRAAGPAGCPPHVGPAPRLRAIVETPTLQAHGPPTARCPVGDVLSGEGVRGKGEFICPSRMFSGSTQRPLQSPFSAHGVHEGQPCIRARTSDSTFVLLR